MSRSIALALLLTFLAAACADGTADQPEPIEIAERFAQARASGDVDSVLRGLSSDAVVDIGPARHRDELAAEMAWQQATGLVSTVDRCEPSDSSGSARSGA